MTTPNIVENFFKILKLFSFHLITSINEIKNNIAATGNYCNFIKGKTPIVKNSSHLLTIEIFFEEKYKYKLAKKYNVVSQLKAIISGVNNAV